MFHNLSTKAASVFIAIMIWLVVIGSRPIEMVKEIPIVYEFPARMSAVGNLPDRAMYTLSGPKASLRAILDRREPPIVVKVSEVGTHVIPLAGEHIRLPIGLVRVLHVNPPQVVIKLEPVAEKKVPVRAILDGKVAQGFSLGAIQVEPAEITIRGLQARIDQLKELSTLPVSIMDWRESRVVETKLAPEDGIIGGDGLSGNESIKLSINVFPSTANLRVRNVEVRVLTPYEFKISTSKITLWLRTDDKESKLVTDPRQFGAILDLRGKPKGQYTLPVKVSLPDKTALVRTVPDLLTVTLF